MSILLPNPRFRIYTSSQIYKSVLKDVVLWRARKRIDCAKVESVKELSNLILDYTGADPGLVSYLPEDKHNILNKRPDIEKAKKKFGHNPKITLEEGVPKTIDWMRSVYLQ